MIHVVLNEGTTFLSEHCSYKKIFGHLAQKHSLPFLTKIPHFKGTGVSQYVHMSFSFTCFDWFLVFNATFSNISAISWRPVLVMEEAGVPVQLVHIITKVVSSNFICYTCTFVSLSIIPGGLQWIKLYFLSG
jgi:hypothetical protein